MKKTNIPSKICIICGKDYPTYRKTLQHGSGSRTIAKRGLATKTCCKNCSKEFTKIMQHQGYGFGKSIKTIIAFIENIRKKDMQVSEIKLILSEKMRKAREFKIYGVKICAEQ